MRLRFAGPALPLALCALSFHSYAAVAQVPKADVTSTATAAPAHPATEAQIREYLALSGTVKAIRELLSQSVKAQRATAAPYFPAAFWDDMETAFLQVDFAGKIVPIYQQFLSTEDMAEIIKFYRTSAGQRILSMQGPIAQQSQTIFREIGEKIGEEVYAKHKAEIDAAKASYENKVPKPEIDLQANPK